MNPELGRLFFKEIDKIRNLNTATGFLHLTQLFLIIVEYISNREKLHFNTLFSRIAYLGSKHKLPTTLLYHLHALRKRIESGQGYKDASWDQDLYIISSLISQTFKIKSPSHHAIETPLTIRSERIKDFKYLKQAKVTILEIDAQTKIAEAIWKKEPSIKRYIDFDQIDMHQDFVTNLLAFKKHKLLPCPAMLHQIEAKDDIHWFPKFLVMEPDFLIGVTTIAECFQPSGIFVENYLISKLIPKSLSIPILIGFMANFFLDELIKNPEAHFKELFPKTFALNPLMISTLSDTKLREVMAVAFNHFKNLKRVIKQDFLSQAIDINQCLIEPSYYSPSYGIQGRLDLLHQTKNKQGLDIIELKSGRPFKPNIYGLSQNHYIQTLLYDTIIKNLKKHHAKPTCYILYSKLNENALRPSPFVHSLLVEAMTTRNTIILMEKLLNHGKARLLVDRIRLDRFPQLKGFMADHVSQMEQITSGLNQLQKDYLYAFMAFISREQRMAKLGTDLREVHGLSGLWRDTLEVKIENFEILNHLIFSQIDDDGIMSLIKSKHTTALSKFRKGDIIVLYANEDGSEDVLESHVMKGTIIEMTEDQIRLRMRSIPMNTEHLKLKKYWHLERDVLDSQFAQLTRSVFEFIKTSSLKKQLLFGLNPPALPDRASKPLQIDDLSSEQNVILQKMILSKDYFLLWGPPGTGKTSVMLKHYVRYFITHTQEQILVMAYTNRAVDEICDSLKQSQNIDFIRVGSRYACGPEWVEHLLSKKIEHLKSRNDIINLITQVRVIVGTVSSITGKPELFQLKNFDRVVIDESSQILEPQLIGLLTRFNHFTLIGDHRQLPAVTLQPKDQAMTDSHALKQIGLHHLSLSLFERLYKNAQSKKWGHAYAMLSKQGRMHRDIMRFPSQYFYNQQLNILDHNPEIHKRLTGKWHWPAIKNTKFKHIYTHRNLFIPSPIDLTTKNLKINQNEAILVRDLILELTQSICQKNNYSIGVITPFRAQIATIKMYLEQTSIPLENITIDTVERYQGGARDIIIISMCLNHMRQLNLVSALSADGVDRKLNVALTRAREQIIMIGNKEVLSGSIPYKNFIEAYHIDESV